MSNSSLPAITSLLQTTFTLTFISFAAAAFFFFLEKDRVPEDFKLPVRVSVIYLSIAAVSYYYMMHFYDDIVASGERAFPTHFRYIDWILTTPLMLLKFPLILGVGKKGGKFIARLVALDLTMIVCGYIGELTPSSPALHYGLFLAGCAAWVLIVVMLFAALASLPADLEGATKRGVRIMGGFVVAGWAIYPLGYFAPLLQLPPEVRELTYNFADLINKVGLCMLVYVTAKQTGVEREDEEDEGAYSEGEPAWAGYEYRPGSEGPTRPTVGNLRPSFAPPR
ncbi:MAG: bacteriorhodopsin [Myxococcota bacterium]